LKALHEVSCEWQAFVEMLLLSLAKRLPVLRRRLRQRREAGERPVEWSASSFNLKLVLFHGNLAALFQCFLSHSG
jgi:hypothetical protein